jgi:hypothetical protein
MTYRALVCLLLASLAYGQAPKSTPAPQKPGSQSSAPAAKPADADEGASMEMEEPKAPDTSKVPADAAVITIAGVCESGDPKSPDCKTMVSKQQFEGLLSAVAPSMPPYARRQMATRYATMLSMANQAEKMGLDKGSKYDEMMKVARLQVLSQELQQDIQEKAGQISDKDIDDYYKANTAAYEEATLQRIFVPRAKQIPPPKEGEKLSEADQQKRQSDAEAAMKTEAESIQKRAKSGGDFNKLQEEAFTTAGLKAKAPNTDMGKVRRSSIPPTHAAIFDLKDGQVSELITDGSGYFIYKMGAKDTLAEDKVKDEIKNTLRAQRMQEQMQKVQEAGNATLNDEYFGPPQSGPEGPMGGRPHMGAMPPGAPKPAPPSK